MSLGVEETGEKDAKGVKFFGDAVAHISKSTLNIYSL